MSQTGIQTKAPGEIKTKISIKIDFRLILMGLFAFLTTRTVIFDVISPFGMSFLAVNSKNKFRYAFLSVIAAVSILTIQDSSYITLKYILSLVFLVCIQTLSGILNIHIPAFVFAPFSLFIVSVPQIILANYSLYSILMLLIETALCFIFVFIMKPITEMLESTLSRHRTSAEQAICFCVMISFVLMGLYRIDLWDRMSIGNLSCAVIILLMARCGNFMTGSVAGILTGLTSGIAQYSLASTVGLYGLCGLSSGVFHKHGKVGVTFGFIATNLLFSIFRIEDNTFIFTLQEQLIALTIFWLIPKKALVRLEDLIGSILPDSQYSFKAKEIINNRLYSKSSAFSTLADSLHGLSNWRRQDRSADITVVFDEAASRICKRCKNCFHCWQNEFNSTYNALLHVSPVLQSKMSITVEDLPEYFSKKCLKVEEYVNEINKQYSLYKFNNAWQDKIDHSKSMITEQLYGISEIMDKLSTELTQKIEFDSLLEKEIIKQLLKHNIVVYDVTVIINELRHYEVNLLLSQCHKNNCYKNLDTIITSVIGIPMRMKGYQCKPSNQKCEFHFVQQENYKIECGVASRTKSGEIVSGDNFGCVQLENGKYIMAVSDGMGSGNTAAGQSTTTVKLLSKFLDAGFDKTTTLKMINSVLLLRSGDEVFATIDIAFIDMFTGNAEFLKLGASPTYILRGGKILEIKSVSLPAGILNEVDIETNAMNLRNNDYIIMLSDGIEPPGQAWVSDFIQDSTFDSPQELADKIVDMATHNSTVNDDMTVLAGRFEAV